MPRPQLTSRVTWLLPFKLGTLPPGAYKPSQSIGRWQSSACGTARFGSRERGERRHIHFNGFNHLIVAIHLLTSGCGIGALKLAAVPQLEATAQ